MEILWKIIIDLLRKYLRFNEATKFQFIVQNTDVNKDHGT